MGASEPAGEREPWPYVPADAHGWPTAEECSDGDGYQSELCKAKLEVRKKRTDQEIARAKAQADAKIAVSQKYYESVFELAKGSIDRTRASAETVQKAGAAIASLYTGVLALSFSVAENPLPGKALFAAILLGASILLATAFLAYLPDVDDEERQETRREIAQQATLGERLANNYVTWTRRAALARGHLLRASVIALAGAVVLLPAPFVTLGDRATEVSKAAWPEPDPAAGSDPELAKILYTAQVAEAAEARTKPIAEDDTSADILWWTVFVVALLTTIATAMRDGDAEPGTGKSPPAADGGPGDSVTGQVPASG